MMGTVVNQIFPKSLRLPCSANDPAIALIADSSPTPYVVTNAAAP